MEAWLQKGDYGSGWYGTKACQKTAPSAAPHDSRGVVADGLGGAGTAKSICVGCHAAGSEGTHSVTGSADYVYLQPAP